MMSISMTNQKLDTERMPGHWVLARMGKRVLRPGGLALTRRMLDALRIGPADHVVEFAPGLGITARMALAAHPASYTGVERDESAAEQVRSRIGAAEADSARRVILGGAQQTPLQDRSATVVYGEAMLTMQTRTRKRQIIHEANRLLRPGGRYGIHELCLVPDNLPPEQADEVRRSITDAIKHQALPLTVSEWERLLEAEGFEVTDRATAPMALLNPGRLVRDEGIVGALRFLFHVLRDREGRRRVLAMRRVFRKHKDHIAAICLIARKRNEGAAR